MVSSSDDEDDYPLAGFLVDYDSKDSDPLATLLVDNDSEDSDDVHWHFTKNHNRIDILTFSHRYVLSWTGILQLSNTLGNTSSIVY